MSKVSIRYVIRVNVVAASVPLGIACDGCFKSPTGCTLMSFLNTTWCAVTSTTTSSKHNSKVQGIDQQQLAVHGT